MAPLSWPDLTPTSLTTDTEKCKNLETSGIESRGIVLLKTYNEGLNSC